MGATRKKGKRINFVIGFIVIFWGKWNLPHAIKPFKRLSEHGFICVCADAINVDREQVRALLHRGPVQRNCLNRVRAMPDFTIFGLHFTWPKSGLPDMLCRICSAVKWSAKSMIPLFCCAAALSSCKDDIQISHVCVKKDTGCVCVMIFVYHVPRHPKNDDLIQSHHAT